MTYSFGFSLPLISAIVLKTGCSPSSCGVEIEANLGMLVVLGEAEEETVVLAAQRDRRRPRVVRLEDFYACPMHLSAET